MVYRVEIFGEDRGIMVLQSLKVSHLSIIPNRFYESPKLKNWMCELCAFSQIRSHNMSFMALYICSAKNVKHLEWVITKFSQLTVQ